MSKEVQQRLARAKRIHELRNELNLLLAQEPEHNIVFRAEQYIEPYLKHHLDEDGDKEDERYVSEDDAILAVNEARKDAVQYALKMAADNSKIKEVYAGNDDWIRYVDEESILSLESQILIDLGI